MKRRLFCQSAAGMTAALALLPHSPHLAATMLDIDRDLDAISGSGKELTLGRSQEVGQAHCRRNQAGRLRRPAA